MKLVLSNIFLEEQSTFIPGRMITDNVLVAYECLHFMRKNRSKANAHYALKLDMTKAYDRVEWNYLEATMLKLGFGHLWVDKVMKCVTFFFSILLTGNVCKNLNQPEVSNKVTQFLPTCFYYVQKGCPAFSKERKQKTLLKEFRSLAQLQK
jgi:hypothetical protein